MVELISQLLEKLNVEANNIVKAVNNKKYVLTVFDDPIIISENLDNLNALKGRKGVYVFLVNEPVSLSQKQVREWNENPQYKSAGFKSSLRQEMNENDCLYVGGCVSNSLFTRIKNHYNSDGKKYSLNLKHPSRSYMREKLRCYAFSIKKSIPEEQYRLILPKIEKELHKALLPFAGSSRV